ncbi:MAG: HdeD family acid-resistance protein [Terrimicrobiaceae bacterium]|nr:HdeD family acid-resistance protein [Terrimicrobiaceae bacterium]
MAGFQMFSGGRSRGWIIFGGVLSIVVGFLAMAAPALFSVVLAQVLGVFLLISGVFGLLAALFGKDTSHRFLSSVSGLIRIAAGWALAFNTGASLLALTIILAAVFLSEGIVCAITAFRMRANPAWIWILLNGVAALILAGMIYARWPSDATWMIGLLYGIQSVFSGSALLVYGLRAEDHSAGAQKVNA